MPRHALLLGLAVPLAACASAGGAPPKLDLQPARGAVEEARRVGAAEHATESFERARSYLEQAEAALQAGDPDAVKRASWLAQLAETEARCASVLASARGAGTVPTAAEPRARTAAQAEALAARLRAAEEEQKRLEERVAILARDLELTETEVIRTKAKLKGLENKADASSAIAEAKVLMRRLVDEKGRTPNLSRCQELLDRAEQQLQEENYGAASFFAIRTQELLDEARRGAPAPEALERPAPKKEYVVAVESVNIRKGPSLSEPVVAKAPRGTRLEASVVRGDWVRVATGDVTGWVSRALLE